MFATTAVFAVSTLVFALSTSLALSLAALTIYGATDAVSVVIRMAMVQTRTPHDMLGRGMAEVKRVRGIAADPAPAVALVPRADLGPSIEASYKTVIANLSAALR